MIKGIIQDFDKLPLKPIKKPRVGVVGEILVKLHPTANNQIVETIEREDDRIVLSNKGKEAVNLSEWYLYSERGDEMYVFPEVVIEPGATLSIGTLSTKGQADLVWQDKKVIHQNKDDVLFLYDAYGFCVSQMNNGL